MIPVNEPIVSDKAIEFVNQALKTGWISSAGQYIDEFEKQFADYLGVKYATTVSNGTTALHLALAAAGIGEGDEVIVPDQTIISCAFAPLYVGAKPVLVDVDPLTGNLDPQKIEALITPKTKAIMVVHLFGHAADMDPIMDIAHRHKLLVIEDAAEAHGTLYKGRKVGSIGDIATFSFYANKVLTTGEGGMVVTNNPEFYQQATAMKNLSHKPGKRFFHEQIGFNFRMTNLQAALGVAHLAEIDKYIQRKREIADLYRQLLADCEWVELPTEQSYTRSIYWMYNVLVAANSPLERDELMARLKDNGVETRTYFYPLHTQPVLMERFTYQPTNYPVSRDLSERGFYLPSGLAITNQQIETVAQAVKNIYAKL